jgi:hypothetical protein
MKRRTVLVLTGMTLLSLAIAGLPQAGFAQSDPFVATWQLNLAKSTYSPGPAPRSQMQNVQAEGQTHKVTTTGTDANGNPTNTVLTVFFDGMPHPPNNPSPNFDAIASTRVDAYNMILTSSKAGKLVAILTSVVSPDGRTMTDTLMGIDANGQPANNIAVYDKQ